MTPVEIELETKAQFPIGSRVKIKEPASVKSAAKRGTVTGYGWGGNAVEGVRARSCLFVLWDGNKTASSAHRTNFELVTEESR
jgi:hypothetical protein